MVTLKGIFKRKMGEKWHILHLIDVTDLGIEKSKWVGRWIKILVEDDGITEVWVFLHLDGDRIK